jgi:hypothetical protein
MQTNTTDKLLTLNGYTVAVRLARLFTPYRPAVAYGTGRVERDSGGETLLIGLAQRSNNRPTATDAAHELNKAHRDAIRTTCAALGLTTGQHLEQWLAANMLRHGSEWHAEQLDAGTAETLAALLLDALNLTGTETFETWPYHGWKDIENDVEQLETIAHAAARLEGGNR